MFGWSLPGEINIPVPTKMTQEELEEIRLKKEAMDRIDREGVGVCKFCDEEIVKNENMPGGGWTWESEFMLGWCDVSKDRKHSPKVTYSELTGVKYVPPN